MENPNRVKEVEVARIRKQTELPYVVAVKRVERLKGPMLLGGYRVGLPPAGSRYAACKEVGLSGFYGNGDQWNG